MVWKIFIIVETITLYYVLYIYIRVQFDEKRKKNIFAIFIKIDSILYTYVSICIIYNIKTLLLLLLRLYNMFLCWFVMMIQYNIMLICVSIYIHFNMLSSFIKCIIYINRSRECINYYYKCITFKN